MNVVHTVGRGIAWSTVSIVLGKGIIFLNIFFILRYLSVYDYGLVQLVLSVISTLSISSLPGLSAVVVADLASERTHGEFGKMKALFLQYFLLSVGLGVVAWIALFLGASTAAHWAGNDTIGTLLKIASFILIATPLRSISTILASIELRFADQAMYGVIEEMIKLICILVFFFSFNLGTYGLLWAIVCSQFLTILLYVPRTWSAYRIFGSAKTEDWHRFWRILFEHRKWSIATAYVGTLGQNLQLWIIRLLLGTEAVGLFAVAQGITSQVVSFLSLPNVLSPILPRYRDSMREFITIVRSSMKIQFWFSIALVGATYALLPVFVLAFPKYIEAESLVRILVLSIIPGGLVSVYAPVFAALKEQYTYFWSIVWKVLFTAVFTWVATIWLGMVGIGIAPIIVSAASFAERTLRLRGIIPEFRLSIQNIFRMERQEKEVVQMLIRKILDKLTGRVSRV